MFLRVLGTLEVSDGEPGSGSTPRVVPGAKERALLGRLLISPGRAVPVNTLIDDLWDGAPPPSARKSLQAHVVRLRTSLEPERPRGSPGQYVVHRGDGYLLAISAKDVDAGLVGLSAASGRAALAAGQAAAARTLFADALAYWRGEAFADWPDAPWAEGERRRLAGIRRGLLEGRIDADLALGRHQELLPELEAMTAAEPLNEGWWRRLMLALYRSERQADALAAGRRARAWLDRELGVQPGPQLRQLEEDILRQSATLEPTAAARGGAAGTVAAGVVPASVTPEAVAAGGVAASPEVSNGGRADTCPYRGLARYEAVDARLLFGRGPVIRALVARVRSAQLVVVSGPSGAGKSSLVRAGLLPELSRDVVPGSGSWRQVVITPGERPVDRLAAAELTSGAPEPTVLVVDQFEELWTGPVSDGEREAFLAGLLELLDNGPVQRLVLVVRGDHLGRLAEMAELADATSSGLVLVPPMTESEVREVVQGPAAVASLLVDPDLTETVLREVSGRAGVLPLLSSALAGTWERRRGRSLTLSGYLECGGVTGALASVAEEALATLGPVEQELAHRMLVRLAVPGDAGTVVRRSAPLAELEVVPGQATDRSRALEAFVAARLVTVDNDRAEVTHEAVFTAWPRLAAWLVEDAAGRAVRAHLAPAAAVWEAEGRPADQLYRGARLEAAQEWIERPDSDPTATEIAFVAASKARSQAELAEARARADAERAGRRRTRNLALVLAATAVVALLAGVLALNGQRKAVASSVLADADGLAAASLTAPSPDLSMLLAVQANRIASTPQTRDALLASVVAHDHMQAVLQDEGIRRIAFGPDGHTLYGLDGRYVRAWDLAAPHRPPRQIADLKNDLGVPASLAVSHTGTVAVIGPPETSGSGPTLRLIHPYGRPRVVPSNALNAWPVSVRFTPDGRQLAVEVFREPIGDTSVHGVDLIDPETRRSTATPFTDRPVNDRNGILSWTDQLASDANRVIGLGTDPADDHPEVWRLPNGPATALDLHGRDPGSEDFFPVAGGVVEAAIDGLMYWYPSGSANAAQELQAHVGEASVVVSNSRGDILASGGTDQRVVVHQRDSGGRWQQAQVLSGQRGTIEDIAIAPDGKSFVSAADDGSIVQWDLTGGNSFSRYVEPIRAPDVDSRGKTPSKSATGPWMVASADPVPTGPGPDAPLLLPSFRPPTADGRDPRPFAMFIDPVSRRTLFGLPVRDRLSGGVPSTVQASAGPPGRAAMATGGSVAVIDTARHSVLRTVSAPGARGGLVYACAWSADGKRIFIGTTVEATQGRLWVVDTSTWKVRPFGPDLHAAVNTLKVRGQTLAAGVGTGATDLIDASSGAIERRMQSLGSVRDVAFSPDGRQLAAVGASRVLDIWQTADGLPAPGSGHRFTGAGVSVQWFPDGSSIAYGGDDGRVQLYDVQRQAVGGVSLPAFQDGSFGWVVIGPIATTLNLFSGARIVHSAKEGASYSLEPAKWEQHACSVVGRDLTRAEWALYLPQRPFESTCGFRTPTR